MSTPGPGSNPTTIPTQQPPGPLSRALDLLDGLLLRTDVPTPVLLDLGDVFGDLLDVRPPYPPTTPITSTDPWPVVLDQVIAELHQLITTPEEPAPPARSIGYALSLRTLRTHQNPPHDAGLAAAAPSGTTDSTTDGVQR